MNDTIQRWDVLAQAHRILQTAVAGVPADGWQRSTPCAEWNVAQVAEHAALDQLLYASSLTGAAKPDSDAFHPAGRLGAATPSFVDSALDAAGRAFAAVASDAEGVPVPLPPFTLPAAVAAGAAALDAAVHGWDIAVATGQPSPLTPALARELHVVAELIVAPLREWGAYAPAIDPNPDADDPARLLLFLGRRPASW